MISVVITTYGADEWKDLAWSRAYPSAAPQADEVVVHHEPDLEIGPSRNAAAQQAKGEWLIFLDADDELEDGYVQAMRDALDGKEKMTLFQPAVRYIRKGGPMKNPILMPPKDLTVDNYLVIGTMIHKDAFQAAGGFSDYPHGFEDWSLWAKAWKAGCVIQQVPFATYRAYINPQSKHRQMWKRRKEQVANHIRIQRELFG